MANKYNWLTTEPSGRAHTHGCDDGRTGWKRHAVQANGEEKLIDIGKRRAVCGLIPKIGWDMDLFVEKKCKRCTSKLTRMSVPIESCEDIGGGFKMNIQELAEDIFAQWVNGNRTDAIDLLLSYPTPLACAVSAQIVMLFLDSDGEEDMSKLVEAIESRVQ